MISKFSLVVTTRCNLRCALCDEFIPLHKPFPDMTVEDAHKILGALFEIVDRVELLHLSGGGEPFLNPHLDRLVNAVFEYERRFDKLMLFTNSTIYPSDGLLDAISQHKDRIIVHASNYGITPKRTAEIHNLLRVCGANLRTIKYHGEHQDYGGWVDFGEWDAHGRNAERLSEIFRCCGVTKHMQGNWRTREGTVHWCQRSQRGMELGLVPDCPDDYVDLFGNENAKQKRKHFQRIMNARYLSACDHCSGDHGTLDPSKRFPAGMQLHKEPVR